MLPRGEALGIVAVQTLDRNVRLISWIVDVDPAQIGGIVFDFGLGALQIGAQRGQIWGIVSQPQELDPVGLKNDQLRSDKYFLGQLVRTSWVQFFMYYISTI